jgi:hypothetical protein
MFYISKAMCTRKYTKKNIVVFKPLNNSALENFEGHILHMKDFSPV